MLGHVKAREAMVNRQLVARGITTPAVIEAMRAVPREAFVSKAHRRAAYEDRPLPIEAGQTISQPFMVAAMIEAADIKPGDRVLEVGTGSGYAAAVMSCIAAQVFGVERHPELADVANDRMRQLGYLNVEIRAGDGTEGWADLAPFDAIIVSAGGPFIPQALREQLDLAGRLVMPVGAADGQRLIKVTRESATELREEDLGGVAFVPLIGAHGWKESWR
jgi:protein-L-isoaspartate(D-aspartate) O-methyltransferase